MSNEPPDSQSSGIPAPVGTPLPGGPPAPGGPIQPGWYPDPWGMGPVRWHDGVTWTGSLGGQVGPGQPAPGAGSYARPGFGYPAGPGAAPQYDSFTKAALPVGRTGLSIVAGYLGLFSVLGVFGPAALVVGLLALRDLKRRPGMLGRGRAIFGIVMGALGTLLFLGVLLPKMFGS